MEFRDERWRFGSYLHGREGQSYLSEVPKKENVKREV